jgi:RNA polymerase sigma factor (sigma-70 family)
VADEHAEERWGVAMAAAQGGNSVAYEKLLAELLPEVTRIARSRVFDQAAVDDVVQNTLLSIHRARHTYRPERPFGPWLRAIARNASIDYYRQSKRRRDREVTGDVIDHLSDERSSIDTERLENAPIIAQAVAELPDKQREAVSLIHLEGLSVAEAALRAGVSVSALKVRAHRGYRALRSRLEGVL